MGLMVGCAAFESVGFSFTEKPPGLGLEQWSVGPYAWHQDGVCSVVLEVASVQV